MIDVKLLKVTNTDMANFQQFNLKTMFRIEGNLHCRIS
jgi:hypothetical protein